MSLDVSRHVWMSRVDPERRRHAVGTYTHVFDRWGICVTTTLPDFRRSVYQVLERGESVDALQRQICTQALPAKRGRTTQELIATSGALTLVTNCVMAWNTQRLQRAADREAERTAPRYSVDALKSIGPIGHRHINFRGTYRFPIDRYAERLVPAAA